MRMKNTICVLIVMLLLVPELLTFGVTAVADKLNAYIPLTVMAAELSGTNLTGFKLTKIIDNGSDDNKLVLIIMGDGYTQKQQRAFDKSASGLANSLVSSAPFDEFAKYINIYTLNVISKESGAGSSPENPVNNYFGSCFKFAHDIERLLSPQKPFLVSETLSNTGINYDNAILIVNSPEYGGSGGEITTVSSHRKAADMLLHEFAHSFAGLADEYFSHESYLGERINLTSESSVAAAPWFNFIGTDGVGLYPLENAAGFYIPHRICKMREIEHPFCAVCTNAIRIKLCEQILRTEKNLMTAQTARPSAVRIIVDGFDAVCTAYIINEGVYFKLTDVAMALESTGKRFSVTGSESGEGIRLYSGTEYYSSEAGLTVTNAVQIRVMPYMSAISLDNCAVSLCSYNILRNDYFYINDVAILLNFSVRWDAKVRAVIVDTTKAYVFED